GDEADVGGRDGPPRLLEIDVVEEQPEQADGERRDEQRVPAESQRDVSTIRSTASLWESESYSSPSRSSRWASWPGSSRRPRPAAAGVSRCATGGTAPGRKSARTPSAPRS